MTFSDQDLSSITPTLCHLMDVPTGVSTPPLGKLLDRSSKVERCLIFAADALGWITHQHYPERFQQLYDLTTVTVDLLSMSPSVTPVCFGSMFTGLAPGDHGISSYIKQVLTVNTIFDDMLRAGKRVAIIAVDRSSIATIFGNRNLDYYIEENDAGVLDRALTCLGDDNYDFMVVYQQEFDDVMHATTPHTPAALEAIDHHVEAYTTIVMRLQETWSGLSWLSGFVTDHGTHVDVQTGKGTHGLDIPEDMETRHFFTFGRQLSG